MQDLMVQAPFMEPVTAETQGTRQAHASGESSFDDVLESQLEDRPGKKAQGKEDPQPEQAAAAVQPQQAPGNKPEIQSDAGPDAAAGSETSGAAGDVKHSQPRGQLLVEKTVHQNLTSESGSEQLQVEQKKTGAAAIDALIEPVETGQMLSEDGESEPVQSNEISTSSRKTEAAQLEQKLKGINQEKTVKTKINMEGSDTPAEKNSSRETVGTQKTARPAAETSAFNGMAAAAGQKSQAPTEDTASSQGNLRVESVSTQPAVGMGTQPNTAAPQATIISEPARSAEAQAPSFLPQVEDGITQMVKSKQTTLRIQLHPEDLGRIQLRLVQDDNGLRVAMHAEQIDTSQLLERHMHSLQKSLSDAGIQLTGFNIGSRGQEKHQQQSWQNNQKNEPIPVEGTPEPVGSEITHSAEAAVDYRI